MRPPIRRVAWISAALAVITLAAFQGVLSSRFLNYDDDLYVTENLHVQQGLGAESVAWALTSTHASNWHPLTWLSHMLDVQLFGLDAGRHHLTSLLLHALNAVLLFLLLVRMTGALWRPALVACLFAIHPLHVESVAWIAERKDVLSTLLWLLTLAAWLRYLASKTVLRYGAVLVLFALGLMAKPMLVTLPFTLLLLDWWPLGRVTFQREGAPALGPLLLEKLPLFAMSATSCIVTFMAQRSAGAVGTLVEFPFTERLANAVLACAAYLGRTFWPASLAVFYPQSRTPLLSWRVALAAILLAGITAFAVRTARTAPFLATGWFWYLGTLVPVIGLIQVGSQARADRYTYVTLIGIFIAIAWGLAELAQGSRALRGVAAAAAVASLAALFAATRLQVGLWTDSVTLFQHALGVTSGNWIAHNNLGRALEDDGRKQEAAAQFAAALRIRPDYEGARLNLGNVLLDEGRVEEAIEQYRLALRAAPGFPLAHNNLGFALARQGRNGEAIDQYREALRLDPELVRALNNLGIALGREGRIPEAIEQFNLALRLKPDYFDAANNMGLALARAKRAPEAVEAFRRAIGINPGSAEGHNNLGVALANMGRMPEAAREFQQAARLDPGYAEARENLRRAQEVLGGRP